MMYKRGRYYEYKTKRKLEEAGWIVWRTPASKSPIDIIAFHPYLKKIKLIQVKSTSKDKINLNLDELKNLKEKFKEWENLEIEVWIYYKKKRKLQIIRIP